MGRTSLQDWPRATLCQSVQVRVVLLALGRELLRAGCVFSSWFLPGGAQHTVDFQYILKEGRMGGGTDLKRHCILHLCYLMSPHTSPWGTLLLPEQFGR